MVGTSVALHLRLRGDDVLLIDRRSPGSETSFGNAGLIQREAVHLTPFPRHLADIFRILPNRATDVRYRWHALFHYRRPLWRYFRHSAPGPLREAEAAWATLIEHCTEDHGKLLQAAGGDEFVHRSGWIALFRSENMFRQVLGQAEEARAHGVTHRVLSLSDVAELVPNLQLQPFVGAIHWLDAWQVDDPAGLVRSYARHFVDLGGEFLQAEARSIRAVDGGWDVELGDGGRRTANRLVVAAGPWSADLIEPLGYRIPLFPMRGYHQHFEFDVAGLPYPVVDMDVGYVLSPMRQGLRLTSGAELALRDDAPRLGQIDAATRIARGVLDFGPPSGPSWVGSRPCLPDMKPVLGAAHRHRNLWFAFGHGHQGFTLGATTGRLLAELVHGDAPVVDPAPFSSARFDRKPR